MEISPPLLKQEKEMKKEIIECDLCGVEIKPKHGMYYHLEKELLERWGEHVTIGPTQLDICRYCLKNLIEPLGKWPEPVEPTYTPVYDGESGGGVDPF